MKEPQPESSDVDDEKPNSVKIACHIYDIKYDIPPEAREYGTFQSDVGIRIASSIKTPSLEKEVLLHECLHAMIHNFITLDVKVEEAIVTGLAPMMLAWLRDNTDLIEYLTDDGYE